MDSFTKAYVEAMFWTEEAPGVTTEEWQAEGYEPDEGSIPGDVGVSDLAPSARAQIEADCALFQASPAYQAVREAEDNEELGDLFAGHGGVSSMAGHDFWLTRNGHGAGFWDGDWPEPHGDKLDAVAKGFGSISLYLGDDGKVYLS